MNFEFSDKTQYLMKQLQSFMDEHVYPNEETYLPAARGVRPTAGRFRR